jgi:DNA-binding NarL/FixJ family response regulator
LGKPDRVPSRKLHADDEAERGVRGAYRILGITYSYPGQNAYSPFSRTGSVPVGRFKIRTGWLGGRFVAGARLSASGAGVVVADASGEAFNALRNAKLGVALWRVTGRTRLGSLAGVGLAVVAAYDRPDWSLVSYLVTQVRTVILSATQNDEQAGRAIAIGAFGYISVSLPTDALRRAILGALDGEPAYSRRVLADQLQLLAKPQYAGDTLTLTPRQREVVTLIAMGAADKEIARSLGITTATAQKHVTNLLKRLGVPNRAAAAAALVSSTPSFRRAEPPVSEVAEMLLRSAS